MFCSECGKYLDDAKLAELVAKGSNDPAAVLHNCEQSEKATMGVPVRNNQCLLYPNGIVSLHLARQLEKVGLTHKAEPGDWFWNDTLGRAEVLDHRDVMLGFANNLGPWLLRLDQALAELEALEPGVIFLNNAAGTSRWAAKAGGMRDSLGADCAANAVARVLLEILERRTPEMLVGEFKIKSITITASCVSETGQICRSLSGG